MRMGYDDEKFCTKDAVIWGAGEICSRILKQKVFYRDYEIKAIIDNDESKWGEKYYGYEITTPNDLLRFSPHTVIVCSRYYIDIVEQINDLLKSGEIDVIPYYDLEVSLIRKLTEKYKETEDKEIKEILDRYENKGFSVYGSYEYEHERYYVYRDSDMMPYILFEGKRMYYPRSRGFFSDDKGEYIDDIFVEQGVGSPHLYVREDKGIAPPKGGVIVDAGVCEGNFALRYIEDVSKVYLIESNSEWIEPLERSFRPYRNKVIICNKFLSNTDSSTTVTLDSLVDGCADFLKMDIEGYELDALMGAKKALSGNCICSICSYHRFGDERNIRTFLEQYGYTTSVSEGYMFFSYDENITETLDFRRGIVYGIKK